MAQGFKLEAQRSLDMPVSVKCFSHAGRYGNTRPLCNAKTRTFQTNSVAGNLQSNQTRDLLYESKPCQQAVPHKPSCILMDKYGKLS